MRVPIAPPATGPGRSGAPPGDNLLPKRNPIFAPQKARKGSAGGSGYRRTAAIFQPDIIYIGINGIRDRSIGRFGPFRGEKRPAGLRLLRKSRLQIVSKRPEKAPLRKPGGVLLTFCVIFANFFII